jgi:hypothetical protein
LEQETEGLTEAEGMREFADEEGLLSGVGERLILERFARDSAENIFFSLLAFHCRTGRWPSRVGVVSWSSKGLRFHLLASGFGLGGRIFFYGTGDYPDPVSLERAAAAEARFNATIVDVSFVPPAFKLIDPLLRNEIEFARKRWGRMPKKFEPNADGNRAYIAEVKAAYAVNEPAIRPRILIEKGSSNIQEGPPF